MLPITNWYPSRLYFNQPDVYCEWMQLEYIPFTDPFFDETLTKARSKAANSSRFRPTSNIDMLCSWSRSLTYVAPTAFIFHVSRCGSTLLSQLLAIHPTCISLAEVPFFDDILRLPFKDGAPLAFNASETLAAAVRLYGQQRTGDEQYLFIKLDSWHIVFWRQLRSLYPDVPFILLYRQPDEVMRSHRKLRGMHAVPGLIEPAIFGFHAEKIHSTDLDCYLAQVLERYFSLYLEVVSKDNCAMLLNYAEGPINLLDKVTSSCGIALDDAYLAKAAKRSIFHAKHPARVFSEEKESLGAAPYLNTVIRMYDRLEQLRLRIKKGDQLA